MRSDEMGRLAKRRQRGGGHSLVDILDREGGSAREDKSNDFILAGTCNNAEQCSV